MGQTVCNLLVLYKLTSPGCLPLCFPTSCLILHPISVNHKRNPQMPMSSRLFQGYIPFFIRQTLTRAGPGDTRMGSRRWSPSQVSHHSPSPRLLSQRHTSACQVTEQAPLPGAWEGAAGRKRSLGLWRRVIRRRPVHQVTPCLCHGAQHLPEQQDPVGLAGRMLGSR